MEHHLASPSAPQLYEHSATACSGTPGRLPCVTGLNLLQCGDCTVLGVCCFGESHCRSRSINTFWEKSGGSVAARKVFTDRLWLKCLYLCPSKTGRKQEGEKCWIKSFSCNEITPLKSHVKGMLVPEANNWLFWFYREIQMVLDVISFQNTARKFSIFILKWKYIFKTCLPCCCLATARHSAILAKLMAAKWPSFQQ